MKVNISVSGLEELDALIEENRRLVDALYKNAHAISNLCCQLNVPKENQPSAATSNRFQGM